jgi:hypothetical protein
MPTIKGYTFVVKFAQNLAAFQEPLNHSIGAPEFRAVAESFYVVNEQCSVVVADLEPL